MLALTLSASCAFAEVNPHLHEVKRVYILAMGSGMDQYLANQLTNAGLFEVVTDPKRADAIVSDSVGEAFENKLDDLYPAPKVEKPQPPPDDSGNAKFSARDSSVDLSGGTVHSSSFGRGKGNYYIVDRSSRAILWSIYERPKNSTPRELTKTAGRVVKHLQEDLVGKKPGE